MSLIYTPSGKAREYSPLALNIYNGCDHGGLAGWHLQLMRSQLLTKIGEKNVYKSKT